MRWLLSGFEDVDNRELPEDWEKVRGAEPYRKSNLSYYFIPGKTIDDIMALIASIAPNVAVIDPLASFAGGRWEEIETDNRLAAELMAELNDLAESLDISIIVLHHVNKQHQSTGDYRDAGRGSSALINGARQMIHVSRMSEEVRAMGTRLVKSTPYNRAIQHSKGMELMDWWRRCITGEGGGTFEQRYKRENLRKLLPPEF